MQRIHFLHIRKTGGTAIKHALAPYLSNGTRDIVLHDHVTTLSDVPAGEKALFLLRDPVTRFVSGFNSRRRKGRPRFDQDWSAEERQAFRDFATANDLANSLSAGDAAHRAKAAAAMQSIRHVNSRYEDWLIGVDYLRSRRIDILWIGFTERLAQDFEALKPLLDLPPSCCPPDDPVAAHRGLLSDAKALEPVAADNIRRWYAADYAFLDYFERPS